MWWDANKDEWVRCVAVISALHDPSLSGSPLADTLFSVVSGLEDTTLISKLRTWETQSDGFKKHSIRLEVGLRTAAAHIEEQQVEGADEVTSRLSIMLALLDEILYDLSEQDATGSRLP